jgi:predicted ATP-grasp superfamily ATP-dependent carboligase
VIGLDCATGLQTARILRERGVRVIGVARDRRHPCARTTACERVVVADIGGPGLIEALRRLGDELEAGAVLFPCTDMSVLLTSRHRAALEERFRLVLPDADVVEMLVDKARFTEFAQRAALPLPRTFLLATREDAERAAAALRFPAVLKPAVKTPEWERHTKSKVYRVESAAELLALHDRCSAWTDALVVQEWIAGGDLDHYTCNAYFGRDGEPLATLTTRKLRQWPITGGQACLSVEVRDEAVEAATLELFRKAGHRGLGYLEMKRDARTGEYLIIEPNIGRPTGRSATAEAAGVELLYTMYCDAVGWPLPEGRTQTYRGVKWIYFRRDVQSALSHWLRGELTLRDWAASWRGPKVEALFSWRDPVPFWADLGHGVAVAVTTLARRLRPRRARTTTAAAA